jgi:hypothetical protein
LELRGVPSGEDYAWSWSATSASGQMARHATLFGIPMHPDLLARRAASFVPTRSADAEVLSAVIASANGTTSLSEIATHLHEQFGVRFPTVASALAYVTQLQDLWKP